MRIAFAVPLAAVVFACASTPGKQQAGTPPAPSTAAQSAAPPSADLVLRGGKVFVSAGKVVSAIALRGDRVVAIGDDAERNVAAPTRIVELRGRLVTPGMNDAHCHFGPGGLSMLEVDLRGASSLAEIESRVRAAASKAAPGEWILGRGWDQTRLPRSQLGTGGWPTKETLDRAAPANPVYLRRVDGHTGWVNSRALQLAGVDSSTRDPGGGEIVRNARGAATGILKETAEDLVSSVVPEPAPEKVRRGILAALDLAARTGVTSVQTSTTAAEVDTYRALLSEGRLTVRVYGWFPLTIDTVRELEQRGIKAATGDAWIRTGLVKAYADGTLGSRTAYMLEPYSDDPSTRGIQRIPASEMDALVLAADRVGLQVAVHAIGDAANREVLDAIERAQKTTGRRGARHRIEHAQVLDAADIPRFARLGVIASMQPTHATSDMRWAEDRIGHARAEEGAYAWRKLLLADTRIAFGTDFAVEPLDPVEGLYSAVTRQSRQRPGIPPGGWFPEERLSMEEAIALYTAGSAYAEFQETEKGTLEPGKLADLVVWDRDLLTIAPQEILQVKPSMTVVGGRIVFEASPQEQNPAPR
ncbi:MAG TPA: amidohydrolase [Myxococcales bacterium]|nr:amidohydrolase [Myxococcales bacterium]